jgi:uncharacterized RDD family membrane protein YckC
MNTNPTLTKHLAKRLKAYCSNLAIVLLLVFPVSNLLAVIISSWLKSAINLPPQATIVLTLVLGFVLAALIMAFPISRGQTKAVGLAVVGTDGRPLTYRQSLIRTCLVFLSSLPLGMGMWWAAIDKRGRTWADMAMGTKVVLITDVERGENGNRQPGSDKTYVDKSGALRSKYQKDLKGDASQSATGEKLPKWRKRANGLGCLVIIIFLGICSIPTISRMQDEAKEDTVKANMHSIQLAAEEFFTQADSIYPINQNSTTLSGRTFSSLWPKDIKNPYNKKHDAVVILAAEPDWHAIEEGKVVYMPTDITPKGAKGYIIMGKARHRINVGLTPGYFGEKELGKTSYD